MCVRACVHPSGFVRAITSTFMHGFQNNYAQLFSWQVEVSVETFFSDKLKVKLTLEGQMIKW